MKFAENKIVKEGRLINNDILKVDSFLNHQIDIKFAKKVGKFFASHFKNIDKILTIETSGIAFAITTASEMNDIPVVFAKKSKSKIVDVNSSYITVIKSFTRGISSEVIVDKKYLKKNERILIVDDFLAEGNAAIGLIDLCKQAQAVPAGVACVVEKTFQGGRKKLENMGIKVIAGAAIKEFKDGKVIF